MRRRGKLETPGYVGRLILIPWHIGHKWDLSIRALKELARVRVFLAEDPAQTRREFSEILPKAGSGKDFLQLPEKPQANLLAQLRKRLESEDVGLVPSGGAPCFKDPGGWIVTALREYSVPIVALSGPSCLSTVLSLSGLDWREGGHNRFTFAIYPGVRQGWFLETVKRNEPIAVFLETKHFDACMRDLCPVVGRRRIGVYFDLTKPVSKFPYANQVQIMGCADWLQEYKKIRWATVSEITLVIYPRARMD